MKKKLAVFGIAAVIITGTGIDSIEVEAAQENQGCATTWEEVSEWGKGIIRELREIKDIGENLPSMEEIKEAIANRPIQAVRGTIKDGVFRNELFKISFPVDERRVCSEEFMLEVFLLDKSVLDENGQCPAEEMEKLTGGTSYDILMEMPNGRSTFCIFYEKQTLNMTETAYIAMLMLQMTANEEDISFGKVTDVNIGGQTYLLLPAIRGNLTQFIYVRRQGNYIVSLLYTCYTDEDPKIRENFMESFLTVE